MPSKLCRTLLFLSSYLPLFLILALLAYKHSWSVAASFLVIGLVSWTSLEAYLYYADRRINPETIHIASFQRRDSEMLSYIVTYLIPFMADFTKSPQELIALGLFFVVIGFLYVNSNMVHINPMLNFRGFHLYEITLKDGSSHCLLTKAEPRKNMELRGIVIGEHVYLHKSNQ